jgi:translation initiation factor 4G
LTPEKFEKLSNDLLKLDLNSPIILKGVIFLIFEKALDEPKYSSMYAQLCKRLSNEAPNFESSESYCTFLRLLLNVCRDKFENRTQYSKKLINSNYVLTDDDDEKKHIAKQKILGNIKFIGELFKLDMLDKGHLHKMLKQLSEKRLNATIEEKCEDMECFAQLLKTCGKNLEDDEVIYTKFK